MTAIVDPIAKGREAWARLKERERKSWEDWVCVGHALVVGRDDALRAAGAKTPHGKIYTRIFGDWLRANALDDIRQQARYRILLCIENLTAIEKWRAGLDEKARLRFNHPDSIWWNWQRFLKVGKTRAPQCRASRQNSGKSFSGGYHPRPPAADQDVIRRVAAAIRQNWCNDTIRLAVAAIDAYEHCKAELPADPPARSTPRRLTEKSPAQTHAAAA